MPNHLRYNRAIELLEQDKPVFCSGLVWNGNLDDLTFIADSDYDMVIIEMEHQGFSFNDLRVSLQFLLNRRRLADKGDVQADLVPLVRLPPHLNTVEDAQAAVIAARYPQVPGVADFEPQGQRGWRARIAPRYWGLSSQEYYAAADLWPLDPDGNMLLMGIVEEPESARNIRDILREVKGFGAIWAGPGDMSVAMGHSGNAGHPDVQENLLLILAA